MEGFHYREALSTLVTDDSPDNGAGADTATGHIVFTTTGDKFSFRSSMPVDIIRWGFIATVLVDVGARLTINANFRPTIGEDTGIIAGEAVGGAGTIDLGTSAVPAHTTGDVAVGHGVYTNFVSSAGVSLQAAAADNTKTEVPFELDPGEEIMFAVDDAADTTGTGIMFVHYVPRGFHDNSLNATKTPTVHVAAGLVANRAGYMSEVANVA